MPDGSSAPSVFINYACTGSSTKSNEFGMRPMQRRASMCIGKAKELA